MESNLTYRVVRPGADFSTAEVLAYFVNNTSACHFAESASSEFGPYPCQLLLVEAFRNGMWFPWDEDA